MPAATCQRALLLFEISIESCSNKITVTNSSGEYLLKRKPRMDTFGTANVCKQVSESSSNKSQPTIRNRTSRIAKRRVIQRKSYCAYLTANIFLILIVCLFLPASNLFSWDSEKDYQKLSTHTLITEYGYKTLGSDIALFPPQIDIGIFQKTLDEIKHEENWKEFLLGSVAPDYGSKNFTLYQDHFWDPDTDENFTFTNLENAAPWHYPTHSNVGDLFKNALAYIANTAETRVREYFAEAVYLWGINEHERALFYLGMASHYLQDICCPVHASNTIGVLDYEGQHVEFEKFVGKIKENYIIASIDTSIDDTELYQLDHSWYQKVMGAKYIADALRELCTVCGKTSKNIITNYYAKGVSFREDVFNSAAIPAMTVAQKAENILIFAFIYAVTTSGAPSAKTTTFTITIFTRAEDGYWGMDSYGTANAVFWGIEFKDGRIFEQYCGRKSHKIGGRDSYSMEVGGETGQNARKIWVRKARLLPFGDGWVSMAEDNWYPLLISFASSDKGVNCSAEMKDWIKGNEGVVFDIDGTESPAQSPLKHRSSPQQPSRPR